MQRDIQEHAAIYKMDRTHSPKLHAIEAMLKIRFGP